MLGNERVRGADLQSVAFFIHRASMHYSRADIMRLLNSRCAQRQRREI
jgi:hypothetical protein